jgi:hypothetical protein
MLPALAACVGPETAVMPLLYFKLMARHIFMNLKQLYRFKVLFVCMAAVHCSLAYAATNLVNFNTATELPFKEVGAAAAEYRSSGGATGGATDGYLSITDAKSGQRGTVVFDDLDKGLVVKAFTFECDLRIGGGTSRPADGFSLNYVRASDPLAANGSPLAGTAGENGIPEEGSLTGLGIGFDTWQSGNHPGSIRNVVGISIRVEGQLLTVNSDDGLSAQAEWPLKLEQVKITGSGFDVRPVDPVSVSIHSGGGAVNTPPQIALQLPGANGSLTLEIRAAAGATAALETTGYRNTWFEA